MKQYWRKSNLLVPIVILLIGVVLFACNMLFGSVTIPFREFCDVLFHGEKGTCRTIIMEYRMPQALTAVLAGIGLSVSGLLMQTLFRNPLADPSILGISSGSSLGVALVVLLAGSVGGMAVSQNMMWSTVGIAVAAFVGALLVLSLILALSYRLKNMVSLILVGIMIAYISGSLTDVLKFFSRKDDVHAFVIWGLGSFSSVRMSQLPYLGAAVVIGTIGSYLLSKNLNLLLLGERYAENLGVNVRRCNMLAILVSGFLTSLITAFCGPIAFLGLAVPHLARFFFKSSNHFVLIPATALLGMDLALLCNLVSRLPGFDGTLPINSVTALIGAPVVLWVIFSRQKVSKGV